MNNGLTLHPKVAGGGLSACVALIFLWALSYWVAVPPEVAAAFTAALGFIGGWLSPVLDPGVVEIHTTPAPPVA